MTGPDDEFGINRTHRDLAAQDEVLGVEPLPWSGFPPFLQQTPVIIDTDPDDAIALVVAATEPTIEGIVTAEVSRQPRDVPGAVARLVESTSDSVRWVGIGPRGHGSGPTCVGSPAESKRRR